MEFGIALLAIISGLLMLDEKKPPEDKPKDEAVYKIEVKRSK